jgi:hypothetical protein
VSAGKHKVVSMRQDMNLYCLQLEGGTGGLNYHYQECSTSSNEFSHILWMRTTVFRLRRRKNCVLYNMYITIYNKQKGLLKLILLMYLEVNESLTTDVDVSMRFNPHP